MQLRIQQLDKTYPNGVHALNQVELNINQGMFGLLGPNGAGKSTLMRTIATLQAPDRGSIHFGATDVLQRPMELRRVLGYLPQEFGVYPRMSALKLLDYLAQLKGITSRKERSKLIERCLEITNLTDVGRKAVSGYWGGMRQRFGIAQLLLNNPQLIIVDEPTAGLDPAERQRFLNILRDISTDSIVIFSTHIVEDIQDLCTDMAIMNQGRILQQIAPDVAIQLLAGRIWTTNIDRVDLPQYQAQYQVISTAFNRDNSLRIRVLSAERPHLEFKPVDPGLEDVYFSAMEGQLAH